MKVRFVSVMLLVLCGAVLARINESSDDLKKRYGAIELKDYGRGDYYYMDGFLISAVMKDGRSVYISYQMKAPGKYEEVVKHTAGAASTFKAYVNLANVPLDGMDIEALLLINLGKEFERVAERSSDTLDYYRSASSSVVAVYSRESHILSIADIVKYQLLMESRKF
ncbi:MAG: hypothetical protein AB7V07_08560 [Candidatus Delongbacteria bacterium]